LVAFHAGDLAANWVSFGVETVRLWGSGPGTPGYEPITDAQYARWPELAAFLASVAGWPFDASRLYPHHAFTQTTCPGDLDLARIIQGGPDVLDQATIDKINLMATEWLPDETPGPNQGQLVPGGLAARLFSELEAAKGGALTAQQSADLATVAALARKLGLP
jgi:N-acetylmuramoyl-L-alanine amidase